jgi:hypothetical protein
VPEVLIVRSEATERERERKGGRSRERERESVGGCVCVCACERERERGRERAVVLRTRDCVYRGVGKRWQCAGKSVACVR